MAQQHGQNSNAPYPVQRRDMAAKIDGIAG
jgi:hypothetical protein